MAMTAYDIDWDVTENGAEDKDALAALPTEVELPDSIRTDDGEYYAEAVSDYLSNAYGYCIRSFLLRP